MVASEFTNRVFALVDAGDASGFARLFAAGGRIRFGNGESLTGRVAIEAGVKGFFTTIGGLRHTVLKEWVHGADTLVELSADYHRLDGRIVTVPIVSLWHVDESGLIDDYRVYSDLTPVFA